MREIKVKAWNTETRRMVDLQQNTALALDANVNTQLAMQGAGGLFIPFFKDLVLIQHIGLKDEAGTELDWWQDDILEDENGYKFKIEYLESRGRYGFLALADLPIKNFFFPVEDYLLSELSKIGNAHEHPELLK